MVVQLFKTSLLMDTVRVTWFCMFPSWTTKEEWSGSHKALMNHRMSNDKYAMIHLSCIGQLLMSWVYSKETCYEYDKGILG